MPILRPYSPAAPVAHVHTPKSGGTSLHNMLIDTLQPKHAACGLGRHHFCSFTAFQTLSAEAAGMLRLTPESMREDADYIGGHIAFGDIVERFAAAQFLTVAREPYCRTISQWLFWRAWPWEGRDFWGDWGRLVDLSRQSLERFLIQPEIVSVTDNPFTRLLIGDDARLPRAQFIDAADVDGLFDRALANLRRFSFVGLAENDGLAEELSAWLGRDVRPKRENETPALPTSLAGDLGAELTPATLDLLRARSRIDLRLWGEIVGWSGMDREDLRADTLCRALPRFAMLHRGGGPG